METIRIESPFDKNAFIKASKTQWTIRWRKNKKGLRQWWTLSLIIYILGLLLITDKEPGNPFTFIGLAFLIIAGLFTLFRIYSWRTTNKNIKSIAEKYEEVKMDCVYELSEDSIKYWDKEKHLDFKWSVFRHYSLFNGYLVIFFSDSLYYSYLFPQGETDDDKYNKILALVKAKLEYLEIK